MKKWIEGAACHCTEKLLTQAVRKLIRHCL